MTEKQRARIETIEKQILQLIRQYGSYKLSGYNICKVIAFGNENNIASKTIPETPENYDSKKFNVIKQQVYIALKRLVDVKKIMFKEVEYGNRKIATKFYRLA